ncbi:polyphenol oxidase family protein [Desulfobacca acetoxidans]|uniref:Multi-copper polyphenol oxidoreductase, laccase n=1 Tax=Desulfobacca acetoxidans (strain ATCC 700848 / DSM 11109 / ASRB2) TaxID=880072 RepID=F2NJT7_DESAR|nr:polyphenol oxidase family protein [Desulfobacca acetoxidans]AEB09742.1 Multi-copper polyphenol oxidoreductase, laccase [Desulfobacca acetoxidans DSM 11109]
MICRRVQQDGLAWFRLALLDQFPELEHRLWTRCGGVSQPPYEGLNLSFSVGDNPKRVSRNRSLIQQAMGVTELVSVGQIHSKNTLILSSQNRLHYDREIQGIDILITDIPGVGLLIKQADCQAVILYDPETRVIANVHCGWRGNVQNVLGQAVDQLREVFGCRPESLRAGISPSLGPCCAEFTHYREEFPEAFWTYQIKPMFFDLWRLSCDQLIAAGLRSEHIQVAALCTRCQAGDFFSYRRDRITGRNGTVVALHPS